MSFVRVSYRWPGDPEPGRSALDEKRSMSTRPSDQTLRYATGRRVVPTITLPRDAGEFARVRGAKYLQAESEVQ